METIQQNNSWQENERQMSRRRKIVIVSFIVVLFGLWAMMVFYALTMNTMEQAYVPEAVYVPHTQAPVVSGPSWYSPKRGTLMYKSGGYHQPSAVSNTPAPKAAMSSTSGSAMRVYQTSSATLHSYGGGGTSGGASTYSRRSRESTGGGINYTAIAYSGAIYVPTRHDAVTAVGATEAENVAARKMGAPRRIKMGGGEGEWPDEPEDPAPDPEPPVPVGDIPMALMAILAAAYALCVVLRRKAGA